MGFIGFVRSGFGLSVSGYRVYGFKVQGLGVVCGFAATLLATITSITVKMNSEFHKNRLTCEACSLAFQLSLSYCKHNESQPRTFRGLKS